MNWEAAGAIGEIAGAVAVVATLIYFSRQIRSMQQSEFSNVLDRLVAAEIEILKMEKESGALIDRGNRGQELTFEERFQIGRILQAWRTYSFHGHLREDAFGGRKGIRAREFARILVVNPIYLSLWEEWVETSSVYDPNQIGFLSSVEKSLEAIRQGT